MLFFGKKSGGYISIIVFVYQHVLRCWRKTVLNTTIPSYGFLVGSRVEKSNVLLSVSAVTGQVNSITVLLGVVIIIAIASYSS